MIEGQRGEGKTMEGLAWHDGIGKPSIANTSCINKVDVH